MTFPLRQLDAQLHKTVTVTAEKNDNGEYVFRGEDGQPYSWGPNPRTYQLRDVSNLADADGVIFLCPLCLRAEFVSGMGSLARTALRRDMQDRD